jgi:hypothetical protein
MGIDHAQQHRAIIIVANRVGELMMKDQGTEQLKEGRKEKKNSLSPTVYVASKQLHATGDDGGAGGDNIIKNLPPTIKMGC